MDDKDHNTHNEPPGSDVPPRPVDPESEGEGVPIPSRIRNAVNGLTERMRADVRDDDDLVRDYEARYGDASSRLSTADRNAPQSPRAVYPPRKPKHWHDPASIDANERKWAALAHGSTLLTALVALGSGGLGVLLTMFVPLLIYFAFRKRSEYVAFHALQAFTIQLAGTIGWLVLLLVGTIVALVLLFVSIILMILLVGFVLVPFIVLGYILFVLASLLLPLGMVIYAVIATAETWRGNNYRYPYIARWVESQIYASTPSVY